MSEPTLSGSPPPLSLLVSPPPTPLLVLSPPPPQPATATEASASRRTAKIAANRVFLIPVLRSRVAGRAGRTYKLRLHMPSAGAFESRPRGGRPPLHFLK